MLLGGDVYNQHTLSRFFVLHAAVLPVAIILLIVVHLAFIRMHGVTKYRFAGEPEGKRFDFYPDHFYTEIIIGLALMVVLTTLAVVSPAEMGPKADPLTTPEIIKPEWFFYIAFRWLKLFSVGTAVLTMSLVVLVMFLWPFIDERVRRLTRVPEISVYIGIVAVIVLVGMTIWEGSVAH
jgi:ubiquinol-cytochrome c reductase cytochrome b subunit